jgi:hypothetical protein
LLSEGKVKGAKAKKDYISTEGCDKKEMTGLKGRTKKDKTK